MNNWELHALLCTKNILAKAKGKLLVLYGDVPLVESKPLKKHQKDAKNISILGFILHRLRDMVE